VEAADEVLAGADRSATSPNRTLAVIADLINKSLIVRTETSAGGRPLYQMLETVRAYAALQLAAGGEHDDALDGLARYAVDEGRRAVEGLTGPAQAEWLDRVRADLENHRTAMASLIARGRVVEASEIAWGLVMFWLVRGHAAEGLQWYEQVLQRPALPPLVEVRALVGASLMLYSQGDLARARTAIARALPLAEHLGDVVLVGHARTMAGHVEHAAGNVEAARAQFVLAADCFRTVSSEWAAGSALSGQAGAALASGDIAGAERLFDEATSALHGAGPWFLAPVRCFRAVLAVQRGQADEAMALMRESLSHIRDLHDKYAFVYALAPLAAAAALKHDFTWTARLLGARAAVIERTGARVVVAVVSTLLDRAEQDARTGLSAQQFASAYSAGRSASIESLLRDIDAHSAR
jgi:hypothetical protein